MSVRILQGDCREVLAPLPAYPDHYAMFLARKGLKATATGLERIPPLASHLFAFQRHCVEFSLRAGRSGCFLDTGLGKTEIELEWCQRAIEATNQKALILTPLAVAQQTKRRAERWGYEARVIRTIQQTNVLNARPPKAAEDERHLCPLQLDVIERALVLWSNPGDVVLSPFMGIGSEGVVALKLGRKFVGIELKEAYWQQACGYLDEIDGQGKLFEAAQ